MSTDPSLTSKQVVKILKKLGFELARQKGSHQAFVLKNRLVIVPMHNKDLKKGTLRKIIKDAGVEPEHFFSLI